MIIDEDWTQESSLLNDDVWDRLDFLTPPCSPYRDPGFDTLPDILDSMSPFTLIETEFTKIPGEEDVGEKTLTDIFQEEEVMQCRHATRSGNCTSCTQLALAGSELRHDCMWVGMCTAEAHNHHIHNDTPTAYSKRTHSESSGGQIPDIFLDSSAALEGAAGFTHLSDFEDDDEDSQLDDLDDMPPYPHPRPDTPSESSETDTDEETSGSNGHMTDSSSGYCSNIVHEDHSYYRPRVPSPTPAPVVQDNKRYLVRRARDEVSDSDDEIDVVSVASSDSAYQSSSSPRASTSKGGGAGGGGGTNRQSASPHHTATTTYMPTASGGVKRVVRVRTSNLPIQPQSPPSKRSRKEVQQVPTATKRKGNGADKPGVVLLRHSPGKETKKQKLQRQAQQQRKPRSYSRKQQNRRSLSNNIDPEKRQMHNSLERMRRIIQRKAFNNLRTHIPDLSDKEKVAKVEILKVGARYIHTMTKRGRTLEEEKERLAKYNKELQKKLLILRRNF